MRLLYTENGMRDSMIVLQMHNLKKSYVTDLIFDNVSLQIKSNERIGIVGKNGAGKTTLMRIMAGESQYDSGTLSIPKTVNVGYLTQQMSLESDETIYTEMTKPFAETLLLKDSLDEISLWLGEHDYDDPDYQDKLDTFERLQNEFESRDGYLIDSKIKSIVTGLNFTMEDLERPVNTFSGGQKTRLALGQMLLHQPDLLLLDEPTNHLDMETVEWLENYLVGFPGAVAIISHDRYFLDKTVSKIFEIELYKGTLYHGNYSKYLIEKEKRYQLEMKRFTAQQKEIKTLETFVEKNIARASTSGMAKSRRKQLERIERIDIPREDRQKASFQFDIKRESGNDVLTIKNLAIGYEGVMLNNNIDFHVKKADRIAIIGPNGIGKTTLVQTIARRLAAIDGNVHYGSNVSIGYYDQKQAEITSNRTVLEELWHEYPNMNEKDVRSVLGQFLFTQDEVLKQVSTLSGGEKARIQLAKLMLQKNNVLILDEPTNHLDIDSKEVLEQALEDYPGTILFVSHDRYFIDRIADRIILLGEETIRVYEGDYSYYLEKLEEEKVRSVELNVSHDAPSETRLDYETQKARRNESRKLERQLGELEDKMQVVEEEIHTIEIKLTDPEIYNDFEKAQSLNEVLNEKNNVLLELMTEYETLEETLISYDI